MQQLPNFEITDSQEEYSFLKRIIYGSRRKVCVNSKTDTANLNIVLYCDRNNLYLKDKEIDRKMTEY